jgi:Ca2+-binding EF-hand superfamily protein
MITCLGHRSIRQLLAAGALTAMIGAPSPAHADGGGTFSLYDADRNGHLDRQEFETFVASKRNRGDTAEFWTFQRVDTDGDGRVSEQELVDALLADIGRRQP